jgi:hypothetical protein
VLDGGRLKRGDKFGVIKGSGARTQYVHMRVQRLSVTRTHTGCVAAQRTASW